MDLPPSTVGFGGVDPLSVAVSSRDKQTLQMVRDALRRKDAMLAFQPVVMAADPTRTAFYEGLIRIRDETGRVIPAKEFISVTETDELGRQIDALALELGLKALTDNPGLRLSINMSARSIGYPAWSETLDRGLSQDSTVAERLVLEITEASAMVMPDIVSVFMDDMQIRGASFALDDFGAGFTAFRYLKQFFFDAIKIDGQFIEGIASNPDNQVLTQALFSIGRHFEMITVAEKVSNADDAAFLIDAGIDCLQGYHFGAPSLREPWEAPHKVESA
jgi:EAL domain-containing protein (putative c-di-GMP-specific phosphodiesterase class I)